MVKVWWGAGRVSDIARGGPCGSSERNWMSGRAGHPPAAASTLAAFAIVGGTRMQPRFGIVVTLRVLSG